MLFPAHRLGRRAHAAGIRRFAGHVGGQGAASLHHHAQAAETEHFDRHRCVLYHVGDLGERKHARQHRARDAEALVVEIDRLVIGGRGLHRQVQPQLRMALGRIAHQAGVGEDHRVYAEAGGAVDGALPALGCLPLRKGIDGEQHFRAGRVGIAQALARARGIEVEAGEIARVGLVLETHVDPVGAIVHRCLERGQVAGRADQFWNGHR